MGRSSWNTEERLGGEIYKVCSRAKNLCTSFTCQTWGNSTILPVRLDSQRCILFWTALLQLHLAQEGWKINFPFSLQAPSALI